jgi:hypothetical protein
MHGGNVKIIVISEIYKVAVSFCFISGGQFTQPPTALARQVVNGENHNFVV